MNQKPAKVAIVLVNFNGAAYLRNCLESISKQSYKDYEVLMVDNQSVDGSAQEIERDYKIKVIYEKTNVGWGVGSNIGAEYAFSQGAEYILLLNTDTEIESDMLIHLLRYADKKTVVAPTMYAGEKGEREEVWYAGGMIDYTNVTVKQDVFREAFLNGTIEDKKEVDFITGCCMLIHKDIWCDIGGFDSSYFMYYEDVDYCIRLKNAGFKMLYIPSASLYHKVGGSSGSSVSYLSEYYQVRNRLKLTVQYSCLFQSEVIDVLHSILKERNYFQTYYYKKYKSFAMAGIKSFLEGIEGKENNLFNQNFVIIRGFYDREENKTDQWYWGSETVSEIEIRNPYSQKKVMSIITAQYLPLNEKRSVTICVDDKDVLNLQLPEVLHYECIMEPKTKLSLKWITSEPIAVNGDLRGLTFQMANPEVTFRDIE